MKICSYDQACGLCLGCGRTLAEIGNWFSMSDEQRRVVMQMLPQRLKMLKPAS